MTKQENDLIYKGIGDYKGWKCTEIGCGRVTMNKSGKQISAYRGAGVNEWVSECWNELKSSIDSMS